MKRNMGKVDRGIRVVFGLAVLLLVRYSWWWLLGLLPLLTGLVGFCPGYKLFGIRTCGCTCKTEGGSSGQPPQAS
ncbi:MAG: DUF2892 domain-containing protein [Pseudomonadota bacterium]